MMVNRLLGGDVIGGEMVWWQDDRNMLSLTDYGHLTTKPSRQQQNCHQEVDLPPIKNSEAIDTVQYLVLVTYILLFP